MKLQVNDPIEQAIHLLKARLKQFPTKGYVPGKTEMRNYLVENKSFPVDEAEATINFLERKGIIIFNGGMTGDQYWRFSDLAVAERRMRQRHDERNASYAMPPLH